MKAKIQLLPSGQKDHKSAFQIVFYTFWLLPVSVSPLLLEYFNINSTLDLSLIGSILIISLGLIFFIKSLKLLKTKSDSDAKKFNDLEPNLLAFFANNLHYR